MQTFIDDVYEAEGVGCSFVVGCFAEATVDVEPGLSDGPGSKVCHCRLAWACG